MFIYIDMSKSARSNGLTYVIFWPWDMSHHCITFFIPSE